jgi:hypothetical protein
MMSNCEDPDLFADNRVDQGIRKALHEESASTVAPDCAEARVMQKDV